MDPRTVIANRIDLHLRHQLGQGIDPARAARRALCARRAAGLRRDGRHRPAQELARQFRVAGKRMAQETRRPGQDAGPPQDWAAYTSGFGITRPPLPPGAAKGRDSWFSPSRSFGG